MSVDVILVFHWTSPGEHEKGRERPLLWKLVKMPAAPQKGTEIYLDQGEGELGLTHITAMCWHESDPDIYVAHLNFLEDFGPEEEEYKSDLVWLKSLGWNEGYWTERKKPE